MCSFNSIGMHDTTASDT